MYPVSIVVPSRAFMGNFMAMMVAAVGSMFMASAKFFFSDILSGLEILEVDG